MFDDQRIVVVVAHPDDETIGLGGQLASMKDVWFIHVTDGAPRSRADWRSYAQTRRSELFAAAAIAGIPEDRCLEMGAADQDASQHLIELSCDLSRRFEEIRPDVIFTHAYEGGHPDHDATAFAVHHAAHAAELWEFASYHRSPVNGGIETACFLGEHVGEPRDDLRGYLGGVLTLSAEQREIKRRMLQCFASQRDTLQWFGIDCECIRRAPEYDFTEPPHSGQLFYESYDWGLSAAEWLRLVRRAERMIGSCLSR